ncbi:MAG: hypothetical protein IPH37_06515 [Burkholderiales bacterium]|nr:hypothetical protein [Burkholderiales bacterium]
MKPWTGPKVHPYGVLKPFSDRELRTRAGTGPVQMPPKAPAGTAQNRQAILNHVEDLVAVRATRLTEARQRTDAAILTKSAFVGPPEPPQIRTP